MLCYHLTGASAIIFNFSLAEFVPSDILLYDGTLFFFFNGPFLLTVIVRVHQLCVKLLRVRCFFYHFGHCSEHADADRSENIMEK